MVRVESRGCCVIKRSCCTTGLVVCAVFLLALGLIPTAAAQTILRVDGTSGTGGGNGSAWGASAFKYLRDALAQADVIVGGGGTVQVWVADGTYKPDRSNASPGGTGSTSATFAMATGVGIYGGFAGFESQLSFRNPAVNITILSGDLLGNDAQNFQFTSENSLHVVTATGVSATARLDGVTISGGNADATSGGGLLITNGSPTVAVCTFSANRAAPAGSDGGGAVRVAGGSPVFTNCTFNGNWAADSAGGGGALYASASTTITMTGCAFTSNLAGYTSTGGALCLNGAATVTNCTFTSCSAGTGGGGSITTGSGTVVLRNCQFSLSNTNGFGGAVNASASTSIVGCSFFNCQSTDLSTGGGAVNGPVHLVNCRFGLNYSNGPGSAVLGALSLTNCVFDYNYAQYQSLLGAVSLSAAAPIVTNCTFYGNAGASALHYTGTGTLRVQNSIFWENRFNADRSEGVQVRALSGTLLIDRCCVQNWTGTYGGTGNFGGLVTDYPRFINPAGPDDTFGTSDDNLRLFAASPCIDAGDNAFLPLDALDADNDGNTAETLPGDLGGLARRVDDPITADTGAGSAPVVDIGAYEFDAATYHVWTNSAGGDWNTGSNWYPGVPNNGHYSVSFEPATTYSVGVASAFTCGSLTVSRGDVTLSVGANALTIEDVLTIGPWPGLDARLNVNSTGAGSVIANGSVLIHAQGVLGGRGTLDSPLVQNLGLLDPGGAQPGALTIIGDYEPFLDNKRLGAGSIAIDVEGESPGEFDTLDVQGEMAVAGGLIVRTPEGFDPSPTMNLELITFTNKTAGRSFDVVYLPGLPGGRFYKIEYPESGSVNLVVLDLGGDVGFGAQNNSVSSQITAVASGLLDGDALIDIAVATTDGSVILLINGGNDGFGNWLGFTSSIQLSSGGTSPAGLVITDLDPLNANGSDVAVTNKDSDNVVILSRPTAGIWTQAATILLASGDSPIGIAAADFDGNGSIDLCTANSGSNTLSMRPNTSTSNIAFGTGSNASTDDNPTTIDPWDPDNPKTSASVVVGNSGSNSVTFHPNSGTGAFSAFTSYAVGDSPESVLTEDLNNDGEEDIICVNRLGDSVSVMLSSGGTNFFDAVTVPVGDDPRSIVLADVDNDGDLDVAVTAVNGSSQRVVQLLQNATQPGDYTVALIAPIELSTSKPPTALTHGDVNQDGFDDIIAVSDDGSEVADNITVRLNLFRACLSDFNRDTFVSGDDFDAFVVLFEEGDPGADVNHDSFVSGDDFDVFVEHFEAGC